MNKLMIFAILVGGSAAAMAGGDAGVPPLRPNTGAGSGSGSAGGITRPGPTVTPNNPSSPGAPTNPTAPPTAPTPTGPTPSPYPGPSQPSGPR